MIKFVILLATVIGYATALNCTVQPEGKHEIGCRAYGECHNGKPIRVDCPDNFVYNNNTGQCDDPKNVPAPCGKMIDCDGIPDGQYADKDQNCKTYYTCLKKKFLGHNFCPIGTVFDENLDTCNWKDAVPPPCGTMTPGGGP